MKNKILVNDMLVLEKHVDKYGALHTRKSFAEYAKANFKTEESAYLIRSFNMPLKEMLKVINDYDASKVKPDEIKLINDLAKKYGVTKEDIIKRVQDVRRVKPLIYTEEEHLTKERKLYLENWLSKNIKSIEDINKNFKMKIEKDYLLRAYQLPYKSILSFLVGTNIPNYELIEQIANLYNVNLNDVRLRINDVLDVSEYIRLSIPSSMDAGKYHKLVRDNIPDIIKNNGEEPITRTLNEEEYWHYLCTKVMEELREVEEAESRDEAKKELADLYEVLLAMIKAKDLTMMEIEEAATLKRTKNGGFEKRIFLEKVISKNKQNNN